VLGGDQNVATPEERAIIDAMAEGLGAGDGGRHLITYHPRGPGQSSLQLQDAPWLDFHMSQTSHGGRDHDTGLFVERDLALTPPALRSTANRRAAGLRSGNRRRHGRRRADESDRAVHPPEA
jgi:hypothetical protein